MTWFNSVEILSRIIWTAQIAIVLLMGFTFWATFHKEKLIKKERDVVKEQVEDTQSTTNQLQEKNSKLMAELEKSKSEVNELQKKTAPRKLSVEQQKRLTQLLPKPVNHKITMICRLMDNESYIYAENIISLFKKLNWATGVTNRTFIDDVKGDLAIAITDDSQIPLADQILQAFNKTGITMTNEQIRQNAISGISTDSIFIVVGARKIESR